MKIYSYTNINSNLRKIKHPFYPKNITILDLLYFLCAPTLVYEPEFPRTEKIRWFLLFQNITLLVIFLFLIDFLIEQYVYPIAVQTSKEVESFNIFTKLLRLTVPNITVWILFFFSFFHLWLNILAEVLRFGDRLFYEDWWNCTSFDFFWRTWNIPTHVFFYFKKEMVSLPYLQTSYPKWA